MKRQLFNITVTTVSEDTFKYSGIHWHIADAVSNAILSVRYPKCETIQLDEVIAVEGKGEYV